MKIIFFTTSTIITLLLAFFIHFALFKRLSFLQRVPMRALRLLSLFLALSPFLYFWSTHMGIKVLPLITSIFYGLLITLFFSTIFYLILRTLHHFIKKPSLRFYENLWAFFSIPYILLSLYGGFKKPEVARYDLEIPKLPSLSIVQLSDLHIGPVLDDHFLQDVVSKSNGLNPDIVVITGDLIDTKREFYQELLKPLLNLKSKWGVYFILGNHEYYHEDPQLLIELLTSWGIHVLHNRSVVIDHQFNLVGLSDRSGLRIGTHPPDESGIVRSIKNELPTIFLTHQPRNLKYASFSFDLALMGHTHAGQIFPFDLMAWYSNLYFLKGHYLRDNRSYFVSKGTGFWGPSIRFPHFSEIPYIMINKRNKN